MREIFSRYAAREGMTRIAADLNARGVPGPGARRTSRTPGRPPRSTARHGPDPACSTTSCTSAATCGTAGEWVKDPDNPMRRVPRMRPPTEWRCRTT
ncbi:MAG: hypothetical protein IPG25_19400 [Proteobacteria bacterium]|nr:hypothetical protein [Pseudomonadota bacterium]